MIWGITLSQFTWLHVVLSLVGIASGFVVTAGLLKSERRETWTLAFFTTTIMTSVTGFAFPFDRFLPSHWTGVISLIVLTLAVLARYAFSMRGVWRWVYVITAPLALYLNVFVLVVQGFLKVPALNALAPTQAEPPFAIAQGIVLLAFVALIVMIARKFRPAAAA